MRNRKQNQIRSRWMKKNWSPGTSDHWATPDWEYGGVKGVCVCDTELTRLFPAIANARLIRLTASRLKKRNAVKIFRSLDGWLKLPNGFYYNVFTAVDCRLDQLRMDEGYFYLSCEIRK